jgi:D-sedoheptulose 7-phosphate isomerase
MTIVPDQIFTEIQNRFDSVQKLFHNSQTFDSVRLGHLAIDIYNALKLGKRIAFVGNGGSAAESSHLAAEFTGRCVIDHHPMSVICLNESQSALTAIANDYGAEYMFSRQVQAHLRTGDYLIALSTSGRSKNILNAIEAALQLNVKVILWMGDFDYKNEDIDVWKVPSKNTPRVQEVHLVWGHVLAEIVEALPITALSMD